MDGCIVMGCASYRIPLPHPIALAVLSGFSTFGRMTDLAETRIRKRSRRLTYGGRTPKTRVNYSQPAARKGGI
jgi:hypothetical protein